MKLLEAKTEIPLWFVCMSLCICSVKQLLLSWQVGETSEDLQGKGCFIEQIASSGQELHEALSIHWDNLLKYLWFSGTGPREEMLHLINISLVGIKTCVLKAKLNIQNQAACIIQLRLVTQVKIKFYL